MNSSRPVLPNVLIAVSGSLTPGQLDDDAVVLGELDDRLRDAERR